MKRHYAKRISEAVELQRQGDLKKAETIYRHVLHEEPANTDALHMLGVMAHQQGKNREAIASIKRAIEINGGVSFYYSNLGIAQHALGDLDNAIASYRQALILNPELPEALNNLGKALKDQERFSEAIPYLRKACRVDPRDPEAFFNLGLSHLFSANIDVAAECFEKCIALNAHHQKGHFYLSQVLLLKGHFSAGWREYEWREQGSNVLSPNNGLYLGKPLWSGQPVTGKTILVQKEQGVGDAIQFVRYLPMLKERGGRVLYHAPSALVELLSGMPGVDSFYHGEGPVKDDPDIDFAVPLMSLPGIFKTTADTIPAPVPYLRAPEKRLEKWKSRLAGDTMKIGLVWAGNPKHVNDRNRSCRLADFAPLADISGLTWFSLQKGPAAIQIESAPSGMRIVDLGPHLADFADTAAVISLLDLVISVDTAVVHLAGAMDRPAWVLLPFVPDWRWMMEREDSPWYPSLRLFRQTEAGNWKGLICRIASCLEASKNVGMC